MLKTEDHGIRLPGVACKSRRRPAEESRGQEISVSDAFLACRVMMIILIIMRPAGVVPTTAERKKAYVRGGGTPSHIHPLRIKCLTYWLLQNILLNNVLSDYTINHIRNFFCHIGFTICAWKKFFHIICTLFTIRA